MAYLHSINIQIRLYPPFAVFPRFSSGKPYFKEHEICIKTCGNLYQKWREERKFRNVPHGDLQFKITYFDNGNSVLKARKSLPTILAIHGAPGSYKDFIGLSNYFEQKARVIIPNFPDFSVYKPGVFRFSDEEKAQLTKDFLAAISVSRIDVLAVHSSGVYPGLHLCLDNNLPIKSLIMLNPGTYSYDMRAVKHIKFMRTLVEASEVSVFMKILPYLGPILLKLAKVPVRTDNFLDPLLSATTMVYTNVPGAKERFLHLSQKKFPILYAFSKDDKLIGDKCAYELAHLLGVSNAEIYSYDKDGNLKNEGKNNPVLKVMSFEKGSHYVFWKHADIIFPAIEEFLRRNMIDV
ncbi:uncharacterized protein LOC129965421 [Argiope bruennichi]|uniref:uncharacterized protein LOC129965421 n=1 Tax=Argiope bruennichi TaxID=94029 RepID=UPI002494A51F|nr:uncharacterized protein LOC129965421 [Argiope bruennichi]